MKTTKLITGIIMIVLSAWIVFQSFASSMATAFSNSHSDSGSAMGMLVALAYLVAGIVYICTKKSVKMLPNIINLIILAFAGLIGMSGAGEYSDLVVWSWIGIIIGVVFVVWQLILNRKQKERKNK